jgi:hypothetical protein
MSDWLELKTYFDKDDGFLQEVSVEGYKPQEVVSIFNHLVSISSSSSLESELWYIPTESNVKLNQFPCAAEVMLKGEAEAFHMLLKELTFEGVTLPDLGAFIFKDEITLDYRRGSEWSDQVIRTFLTLISKVMIPRPEIVVKHQECEVLFEKHLTRSA